MNTILRHAFLLSLAGVLVLSLTGCGNKGPLMLPAAPPAPVDVPVNVPDAPAPVGESVEQSDIDR